MELLLFIQRVVWVASLVAEALVAVRLLREGLLRSYPLFATFLAVDVVNNVVLLQIDFRSPGYAEAFRICTLIIFVFRFGAAAELYERICEHFPGIGPFRIGLAAVLVLLAALLAVVAFRPNLADQWAFPRTIVMVIQRFQGEVFAAVFVFMWIFLRFVLSIRQPFQPNVLHHWRIATIYFGVSGAAHLVALLTGRKMAILTINSAMLAVQLACFLTWLYLMRRSGEELPAFQRLSPDQAQAIEQYNRELLHAVTSLPGEISGRPAENRDTPLHRAWRQ